MSAGNLLQLRSVGGIASLDSPGFWQPQLVKENALQLRLGVDFEALARELLNRPFEGCHFLSEFAVQLLKIAAIDEDSVVLHAREHLDQGEFQDRCKLPDSLIAKLRFESRGQGPDRHRFTANTKFVIHT